MANKKISELAEVTTPVTGDEIAIINSSSTKRVSVDNLVWKATDFNTTTGHDHDGSNSKVVDHTDCDNIGSNTHPVVDAHLASASNPHTVTASQVGNTSNQWNADKIQSVDVAVTAPTNSQVLAYNGSSLKYEPTSAAAPGAHASTHNEGGADPITFPTWIASGETWTYASASTFTVPTDLTAKYTKGTKIQLTNDSATKYYYVVSSAYGAPNTTVTLSGEVLLANSAISSGKLSYMDNPLGFKRGEDWFRFRASNATQSIANAVATKVQAGTEAYDPNANYDAATNFRYTVPADGYYDINAQVEFDLENSLVKDSVVLLYKDGSLLLSGTRHYILAGGGVATVSDTTSLHDNIWLTKGEYLELFAFQQNGATRSMTIGFFSANFTGV